MELELGLKLTRADDELASEVHVAKDHANHTFLSRETEATFVLTAHLKGYKRRDIKIDINEDGTIITIRGKRRVKETVIVGWNVYNKDPEVKGFKKVFGIPKGVNLDKINAKFNEDESSLIITMPKKVKGIIGKVIEEIEEKEEDEVKNKQKYDRGECSGTKQDEQLDEKVNEKDNANNIHDEENDRFVESSQESRVDGPEREEEVEQKNWGERLKICTPIVAGSALLLSFVVLVIQIVRNQTRRKD